MSPEHCRGRHNEPHKKHNTGFSSVALPIGVQLMILFNCICLVVLFDIVHRDLQLPRNALYISFESSS